MSIKASLIVPTRNRASVLRQSLSRFLDQSLSPEEYEVIIADDGSEDDTPAVAREFAGRNVVYRRLETARGAATARNRAIAAARSKLLLFVDDDALVRSDFVAGHVEMHERFPRSIVTGPIIEVDVVPEAMPLPEGIKGRHSNPFPTGNASVARKIVIEAGGFDEDFRAYGWEDPELYRRLARSGAACRFTSKVPIFHYKPATQRSDFLARLRLEEKRGAMGALFFAKHPAFAVGWQTKQLKAIRALDTTLNRLLGLDEAKEKALREEAVPDSGLLRLLLINHAEIEAGRREWERLGPEKRRQLARAALARGRDQFPGGGE